MNQKEEAVIKAVAKVTKKEESAIKPEQELMADLGVDSPKGLQLLMELETALNIEITDDEAAKLNTVGDILKFVNTK